MLSADSLPLPSCITQKVIGVFPKADNRICQKIAGVCLLFFYASTGLEWRLWRNNSLREFVWKIGGLDVVHSGPNGVANVGIELLKLSNQLLDI